MYILTVFTKYREWKYRNAQICSYLFSDREEFNLVILVVKKNNSMQVGSTSNCLNLGGLTDIPPVWISKDVGSKVKVRWTKQTEEFL